MASFLTQVLDAVADVCTGLPTTASRVYRQDKYPWQPAQLPGLVLRIGCAPEPVYLDEPTMLQFDADIRIDAVAAGPGDLVATLDTIAAEVMAALAGLTSIGGKAVVVRAGPIAQPEFGGEADPPAARRTLNFTAGPLFVSATAPSTLA